MRDFHVVQFPISFRSPSVASALSSRDTFRCAKVARDSGSEHTGTTDMAFQLFTKVALKVDLPAQKLRRGDVATVVESHPGQPGQEPGYSLEVFNALGETLTVVTVSESHIEELKNDEVLHVRRLDAASPT